MKILFLPRKMANTSIHGAGRTKMYFQDTEMIITRVEILSSIGKCGLGLINKYFERQKTLCLIWRTEC